MLRIHYIMLMCHNIRSHQSTTQIRITIFNKVSLSGNPRYIASNRRINPNNHVMSFSNYITIPIRLPSMQNTKPYKFLFYQSLQNQNPRTSCFLLISAFIDHVFPRLAHINHHPLHIMHQLEILKHKKFPL